MPEHAGSSLLQVSNLAIRFALEFIKVFIDLKRMQWPIVLIYGGILYLSQLLIERLGSRVQHGNRSDCFAFHIGRHFWDGE